MSASTRTKKTQPTFRQLEYLTVIRDLIQTYDGRSPTIGEIAVQMKVKAGSAQDVLAAMKDRGMIQWEPGKFRTIRVGEGF